MLKSKEKNLDGTRSFVEEKKKYSETSAWYHVSECKHHKNETFL